MHIDYPNLGAPPKGWTAVRHGKAIRLIPPGAYADRCRASMVVSPLMPVSIAMPNVETIIRQALSAEVMGTGMTIETESEITDVATEGGLQGKRLAITVRHRGASQIQRRLYSMYRDASWLYGIHYIADAETYEHFLELYRNTADSIQAVPPPEQSDQ